MLQHLVLFGEPSTTTVHAMVGADRLDDATVGQAVHQPGHREVEQAERADTDLSGVAGGDQPTAGEREQRGCPGRGTAWCRLW